MRAVAPVVLLVTLAACGGGGSGPTPGPSPVLPPAPLAPPQPISVIATLTSTTTGQPIGTRALTVRTLPELVTLTAQGYVTRETWVSNATPTVDLFPEAGFDLAFYRQFARGTLEEPMQPLRVLSTGPAIYLQRTGLTDVNVAALQAAARAIIPALTGGRFQASTWTTGDERRQPQHGWITVELVTGADGPCGYALIGVAAGDVRLNTRAACGDGRYTIDPGVFAHELGHALGFWHVTDNDALMKPNVRRPVAISALERHHAALAYARSAGNLDVDRDVQRPAALTTRVVVD